MAASVDKRLSESFNEFSLDLYKNLAAKDGDNLFMSPSSVMVVMAMVRAGARGNTDSQMKKTLKLDKIQEKDIHQLFEGFVKSMKKESDNYTLTVANRLYPHVDKTIIESYLKTVENHFITEIKPLDYTTDPDGSRIEINKWVEQETKSKIKDLLAPGVITPLTALVVVNAIYFKGDWANQFDKETTSKQAFYVSASKSIKVDMMFKKFKKTKYGRIENLDCSVLSLPYKGEELSMLILLPNKKDGLGFLEKHLTAKELINMDASIRPTTVDVSLPKFKLESSFQLKDCLSELGMPEVFHPDKADLSGMSGMQLFVSHVVHKAYVDVNEEGTEAAAATAAVIMKRSKPITHRFEADHPFVFVIWDDRVKIPLFVGRVVSPPGDDIAPQREDL